MTKTFMRTLIVLIVAVAALGSVMGIALAHSIPVTTEEPEVLTVRNMYGVVIGIENGIDGVMADLDVDGAIYSVTISGMSATVFGSWGQISEGTWLTVSGELIDAMEPPLVVADTVVIDDAEAYIHNLTGTVSEIKHGKDGIMVTIQTGNGDEYPAIVSLLKTEVLYIEGPEQIGVGAEVIVSGETVDLGYPHVVSEFVVVYPPVS